MSAPNGSKVSTTDRARVFNHQDVHDLIQSKWESDLPDRVLQSLTPLNGKAITTRLLNHLPKLEEGRTWRLIRHYGWTSLQTSDYGNHVDGVDIMLARSEASVPLDLQWVEKNNAAYYGARKDRNHARMEAMNTKATLDAVADAMSTVARAKQTLLEAQDRIETLCAYGTTLDPDKYTIYRACGLMDKDGQRFINDKYKL